MDKSNESEDKDYEVNISQKEEKSISIIDSYQTPER